MTVDVYITNICPLLFKFYVVVVDSFHQKIEKEKTYNNTPMIYGPLRLLIPHLVNSVVYMARRPDRVISWHYRTSLQHLRIR